MGTHALRLCERRRAGAVNRAENHFSRDGFTSTSFCSAASTSMDCCGHAGAVHSGALNTTFRTMITRPRRGDPPAASTSPHSWARCEPGMRADPDRASAHATPPPIPSPHSRPSPRSLNESDPGPSCAQRSTKPAITAHPNGTENAGYGPSRDRKLPCGRASVSRETFPQVPSVGSSESAGYSPESAPGRRLTGGSERMRARGQLRAPGSVPSRAGERGACHEVRD